MTSNMEGRGHHPATGDSQLHNKQFTRFSPQCVESNHFEINLVSDQTGRWPCVDWAGTCDQRMTGIWAWVMDGEFGFPRRIDKVHFPALFAALRRHGAAWKICLLVNLASWFAIRQCWRKWDFPIHAGVKQGDASCNACLEDAWVHGNRALDVIVSA